MNAAAAEHSSDWPLRPWVLAGLLGGAGLLVWLASGGFDGDLEPWRAALTALFFFGPIALAVTLDKGRWKEPGIFAAIVGIVMAGIAWRVASADENYDSAGFWLAAGVVASALALPLFQAGFHRHRWRISYKDTHYHVWTDAITVGGSLAFTGLAWLVLALLADLFHMIRIDLLRDLIGEEWFGWTFSGVAFGAALGVLRNQLKVIGTLQNVVLLVLSLIAVPLAVALVLFLLAVIFSGLDVLWEATRSATPLLLMLAAGSFVLVNAVLRDEDATASRSRVMRIAACVLALGILPLSILAAISMGTRIAQHGLTPERIWGLIAIMVAVAYGVGYFVAAIRSRRRGWDILRQANLHLAVATCVIALLLAMPILDFGAISTRNQLDRLEAGKVSAEDFDYEALKWDFGDAGREALQRLAKSSDSKIATLATEARERTERWSPGRKAKSKPIRQANMRIISDDPVIERRIREYFQLLEWHCNNPCALVDTGINVGDKRKIKMIEQRQVTDWLIERRSDGGQQMRPRPDTSPLYGPDSRVEIREWAGRRIYIDGEPAGEPFE